MADTVLDLAKEALERLGRYRAGESLNDDDADLVLRRYNALLDGWNAERGQLFADLFTTYTLTAGLSPHTIGPTGTFVVTERPVAIKGASMWLGTTPDIKIPLVLRDQAWWNQQRVPSLSVHYPQSLFYNPTWPDGELHFWAVPSAAYQVELWTRQELSQVTLTTTFALPQGYRRAHVLTLAEDIAESFGAEVSAQLAHDAARARRVILDNNPPPKRLRTRDAGMPKGGGGRRTFIYQDRSGI